ncbi:MAG: hypothetical protein FWH00_04690, partial [Oscillospiraceae bacterium]|nr:hypothetical protein [Oscillospiraceae bacterium]
MVRDLLKTPLLAVFYASFFFLLEGFMVNGLPVFSESYWETAPHYGTDLIGYLMLLLWAFLLSVIICLAFHFMQDTKILSLIFLGITIIGYQLIIPAVMPVWYGDRAGILTTADIIFDAARGAVCTVVLIILAVLLIHPGKAVNPGGKKAPAEYKIKMPALIARVLALPFIYLVLYLFSWYFLGWRNEAVRAYSEGPEYSESLVTAVVNLLLRDNSVLPVALCVGLLYVLFALPLMT